MKIYGVAILAFCFLVGKLAGNLLGVALNIDGDIGGVGFAMIFLIVLNAFLRKNNLLVRDTELGILFWTAMYIPIIVAMSATQNMKAAISGGPLAIIIGVAVCVVVFSMVPVISKIGRMEDLQKPQTTGNGNH